MKQIKDKLTINWNFETKTMLLFFLLLIFAYGAIIGGVVGKRIATKACESTAETTIETTEEPPTESTVEITTEIPTKEYYDCPLSDDLQEYIFQRCEENNLPIELVMAVIEVESHFDADAISETNDYGLMQINKCNHERFTEEYGITDFLDPYDNVFCGIKLLSEHYARYGDIDKTLMSYNSGAFGAKKLWDMGINKTYYTTQVRTAMETYEG
jgi:hypothetical protein